MKKAREQFISNDNEYETGMKLLESRYETNIDNLIRYGVRIKKRVLGLCYA